MSTAQLHVTCPEALRAFAGPSALGQAIRAVGRLACADVAIACAPEGQEPTPPVGGAAAVIPVAYRDRTLGQVVYRANGDGPAVSEAARALAWMMEHAIDREIAVADLAEAMNTSYEELNMLYSLMSEIVTRTHAPEIGQIVVDEAVRILNCRRASLLVLDEPRRHLQVLAARGLPAEVVGAAIPLTGTIAGQVLFDEDVLLVNDLADRPDLIGKVRGNYQTQSFLVVRVPLFARGEPIGILTATERHDRSEFTSRDRRLVEGLSSLAASALLNCRLHGAVNRQMIGTIKALASAVDAKDRYTHAHSARVAELCLKTAPRLGLTGAQECREIELAGLLHDIGKIGISDAVLRKSGSLTAAEREAIKTHPGIGARIVEQVQGLAGVAKAILHHHERYDGLGYPAGLLREQIPLASRLIAAADTFDALTSDRPYRKAMSVHEALQELHRHSGTQLAPDAVDALVETIAKADARPQLHLTPASAGL